MACKHWWSSMSLSLGTPPDQWYFGLGWWLSSHLAFCSTKLLSRHMVYQMLCLLCNPLQLCHRKNGYHWYQSVCLMFALPAKFLGENYVIHSTKLLNVMQWCCQATTVVSNYWQFFSFFCHCWLLLGVDCSSLFCGCESFHRIISLLICHWAIYVSRCECIKFLIITNIHALDVWEKRIDLQYWNIFTLLFFCLFHLQHNFFPLRLRHQTYVTKLHNLRSSAYKRAPIFEMHTWACMNEKVRF